MSLLQQTVRKALQNLLPTCLIDIVVGYLPRVLFRSWRLLQSLSKGPVTLSLLEDGWIKAAPAQFDYPPGYGITKMDGFWRICYPEQSREFEHFTLSTSPNYPIELEKVYEIEIDPDCHSILSIDGVLVGHNVGSKS